MIVRHWYILEDQDYSTVSTTFEEPEIHHDVINSEQNNWKKAMDQEIIVHYENQTSFGRFMFKKKAILCKNEVKVIQNDILVDSFKIYDWWAKDFLNKKKQIMMKQLVI